MKKLLFTLFLISISLHSFSVYLEKVPYQLIQPNGEILNVFITGDEFYRRVHDAEDYSIIQREDGWYVYANYDSILDELVASNFIVSETMTAKLPMQKGLKMPWRR